MASPCRFTPLSRFNLLPQPSAAPPVALAGAGVAAVLACPGDNSQLLVVSTAGHIMRWHCAACAAPPVSDTVVDATRSVAWTCDHAARGVAGVAQLPCARCVYDGAAMRGGAGGSLMARCVGLAHGVVGRASCVAVSTPASGGSRGARIAVGTHAGAVQVTPGSPSCGPAITAYLHGALCCTGLSW